MTWHPNNGSPPDPRKLRGRSIFVRWGSGKEAGPFDRSKWSAMNWSLDAAMPIKAVKVEASNG